MFYQILFLARDKIFASCSATVTFPLFLRNTQLLVAESLSPARRLGEFVTCLMSFKSLQNLMCFPYFSDKKTESHCGPMGLRTVGLEVAEK